MCIRVGKAGGDRAWVGGKRMDVRAHDMLVAIWLCEHAVHRSGTDLSSHHDKALVERPPSRVVEPVTSDGG